MPARSPIKSSSRLKARFNPGKHGKLSSRVPARRAILFCGSALVFAVAIYIMATHGFDAVVKCEVENYHLLQRSQSAMTKIAGTNPCGF